jgi:hypothetical protein
MIDNVSSRLFVLGSSQLFQQRHREGANMATLISIYNSEGIIVGRCDARCYDAKTGTCTCICGGINHKAGKAAASANVLVAAKNALKWVETHREQAGEDAVIAAMVPLL